MPNTSISQPITFADNVWTSWADLATVLLAGMYHERGVPVAIRDFRDPMVREFIDAQGQVMLRLVIGEKGAYLCQKRTT